MDTHFNGPVLMAVSNRKFTERFGGGIFLLFEMFFWVAPELSYSCVSNWFLREFLKLVGRYLMLVHSRCLG